jgi:hypothetical protein
MPRSVMPLAATIVLSTLLTGCGLAETGVAGAAAGASQAEQVRQAKETEARVQKQLDAARQQEDERLRAAESQ